MSLPADTTRTMPVFPPRTSAVVTSSLADRSVLDELRGIVGYYFGRSVEEYVAMGGAAYQALVAEAQDEVNRRQVTRRLAEDRRAELVTILGTDAIMIQTNLYLRATRPKSDGQEHIGFHRESFYGPDLIASVNLWMPIQNVTVDNAMRYVPDSHLIADEAIKTVSEDGAGVVRFSAGHRIGLLYSPKRIVEGVDLTTHRPLVVTPGEIAIFSGALIHGAAENRSHHLRFSVDFRVIAEANLTTAKEHFASGKAYFERL